MNSLEKFVCTVIAILAFTFCVNFLQVTNLVLNLRNEYQDWKVTDRPEARTQILSSSVKNLKALSKSLDTPMSKTISLLLSQQDNMSGIAKSLDYAAELIEDTASIIVELSLAKKEDSVIDVLDRNLPLLVLNASHLNKTIGALNSIEWNLIPLIRKQGVELEKEISLINEVWSKNYQSIGSWTSLVGAKEPKRYFVALQNSAQARGTGGMPGTFAIIEFNKGEIEVIRTGTNSELRSGSRIPIDVPKEFTQIYRNYPAGWNPSNLSPHFPYAARIWLALWKVQTGEELDGAMALDSFVLASMLKVTGNIEVYGKLLRPNNVVDELLSKVYREFENDNQKRKNFLAEVVRRVGNRIEGDVSNSMQLIKSLLDPISQGRVLIYSSESNLQQLIQTASISGSLNYMKNNDFRAIVLNTSGNKMDYYLERSLVIKSMECEPRKTKVEFRLKLEVDPREELPDYVNGRKDLGLRGGVGNSHGVAVLIFGPRGSSIVAEEPDAPKNHLSELGRPVWLKYAELAPRVSQQFKVTFYGGKGPITTSSQPLVKPQVNRIQDRCSS